MKKTLLFLTIIASIVLFSTLTFAAKESETVKIGIFDMQKIIRESKAGKQAQAIFEKELAERRKTLQEKEQAVRTLEEGLKKTPASKRREKEEEFSRQAKELKRLRQDLEEELKKKDAELASKLIKDVLEIAREIGQKERYTVIFQKGMDVVYVDRAVDITSKIMEKLDARSKK